MKKWVALFMVLVMTMSMSGALAMSTDYKDYSCWPITTDEDITINIGMVMRSAADGADPAETWFWTWASEKSGLKFTFDTILDSARSERKALMFAADELPDVLWNYGLSANEIVKYGSIEQQLIPLNEYINEETMPNLMAWLKEYPDAVKNITAPDGNIYSLPYFYKVKRSAGGSTSVFTSDYYLNELGLKKPSTLDEMIEALYAFKAAYPEKTPIGACANGFDIRDFFLNAMGYLGSGGNDYGMGIAIRDGKLVIPCADETFLEFLTLMNKFYKDGIISEDFFLIDSATMKASVMAHEHMLQEGWDLSGDTTYEDWIKWSAQTPLTSALNAEPKWLAANLFQMGGFAVSYNCQHVEELMKFMDFLYSDLAAAYVWYGPVVGHPDVEGWENVGFTWEEGGTLELAGIKNGVYADEYHTGLFYHMPSALCVGNNAYALNTPGSTCVYDILMTMAGHSNPVFEWDMKGNRDNYMRGSIEQFMCPYETTDYPYYVYFTEEQTERVSELSTVLDPYVETEVAEFITGARPLTEFAQFVQELESMGIREYEQIYRDATGR